MDHFQTDLDLVAPDLFPWLSSRLFPDITGFLHELAIVHQHRSLQGFVIPRFEAHSQISYLKLALCRSDHIPILHASCNDGDKIDSATMVDGNIKIEGTFLKKDDPKILALYQQAELLSSLAMKVNTDKTQQSLENASEVLGNFLNKRKDNEFLNCGMSEADLQLVQLSDLLEDLRSRNTELLKGLLLGL